MSSLQYNILFHPLFKRTVHRLDENGNKIHLHLLPAQDLSEIDFIILKNDFPDIFKYKTTELKQYNEAKLKHFHKVELKKKNELKKQQIELKKIELRNSKLISKGIKFENNFRVEKLSKKATTLKNTETKSDRVLRSSHAKLFTM